MEKKEQKKHKFNHEYNQAIIALIRRKVSPLHQPKKSAEYRKTKKPSKTTHAQGNKSLPRLPPSKIYNILSQKQNTQTNLLDKVREHLEMKRKENHFPEANNELQQYMSIFERPVSHKERVKRQSIEYSVIEFQKRQSKIEPKQMLGFHEEQVDLTDDARSILNAKIRRKLNHKKLIDVYRRG